VALGLAEADAVDDGGVVQGVGDDGVLLAEDRLEQAAVSVPAGTVKDRIVLAEKAGDGVFELLREPAMFCQVASSAGSSAGKPARSGVP
jgi:hypothetical protein